MFTFTSVTALKNVFRMKLAQQMNLQRMLYPLRLCLDRKALGTYMGTIRWLLVYIYICV
jgi:hypothetical protein